VESVKLKAIAAVAALCGILWILQGVLVEPEGPRERAARSAGLQAPQARAAPGEAGQGRVSAPGQTPSVARADSARAASGVAPLSSKIEISLTLDGVPCPRPQIRFREAEDAPWTLAEVGQGRALLPLDPAGEGHLEFEVLGPKGEPLDAAWGDFEAWDDLRTSRQLFAANAAWSYRGRLLEGDEELLELCAFTHRKIRGRVLDEEGRPASGAEVNVRGLRSLADAGGNYALDLPPRGPAWHVTVHAKDGQGAFGAASVEQYAEFSGPAAEGISRVDIQLSRALRLRGTVRDEDGEPLAAEIKVAGCDPVRSSPADGTFVVAGISPDPGQRMPRAERRLAVSREGYRSLELKEEIRPGGRLDCVLVRTRPFRGRVVDALGQPLSGVWVGVSDRVDRKLLSRCYSRGEVLTKVKSDSRGRFELQVVAKQRYLIARRPDRPYRLWSMGSAPGEVELTLPAGAEISGRLLDSLGAPQDGVEVSATLPGEPSSEAQTKTPQETVHAGLRPLTLAYRIARSETEEDGSFSLKVPDGHYDLHIGEATHESAPLIRGVSAGGSPLTLVREQRADLGQVHLHLKSSSGAGVEAEVFVKSRGQEDYGHGNDTAEGKLALGLEEGLYEIWISAPNHLPQGLSLSVSSGQTLDLGTLTLELGGGSLEVKLPDREPFGALWINFRDAAGGPRRQVFADTSRATVRLTGLTPGSLSLSAELIDEDMGPRANYVSTYPEVGPFRLAVQAGRTTELTLPVPK